MKRDPKCNPGPSMLQLSSISIKISRAVLNSSFSATLWHSKLQTQNNISATCRSMHISQMVQLHNKGCAHRNGALAKELGAFEVNSFAWGICVSLITLVQCMLNIQFRWSVISKSPASVVDNWIHRYKCTAPTHLWHLLPGLRIGLHFPEGCIGNSEPCQPCSIVIYNVTRAIGRSNNLHWNKYEIN